MLDGGLEVLVELMHHVSPLFFPFGNLVELFLDFRGEVIIHDAWEVLHQEVVDYDADVGREKLSFLISYHFLLRPRRDLDAFQRIDGVTALFPLVVSFLDILALLDCADGWGIRRRAPNA